MSEEKLGKMHPSTATLLILAAKTDVKLGDWGAAKIGFEEVLEARRAALGKDHPPPKNGRSDDPSGRTRA